MRECLLLQARATPLSLFSRLFGIDPLDRDARRSYSGALAELAIEEALAALGSAWTVLHSVPIAVDGSEGRPDTASDATVVDHLLIGPAGIFTITTHSHAGQSIWVGERTFLVDDERLSHLAAADDAGSAVSRFLAAALAAEGTKLDAVVAPCIVVDAPETLEIRQRTGRTTVITAHTFAPWLNELPRLLSPVAVESFARAALRASTWPARCSPHQDAPQPLADFDPLRRRVASARLRRLIWTAVGVVLSYALVIASVAGLSLFGLPTALGR